MKLSEFKEKIFRKENKKNIMLTEIPSPNKTPAEIFDQIKKEISEKTYIPNSNKNKIENIDINIITAYQDRQNEYIEYILFCLNNINLEKKEDTLINSLKGLSNINKNINSILTRLVNTFDLKVDDCAGFVLDSIICDKRSDSVFFSSSFSNKAGNRFTIIRHCNSFTPISDSKFIFSEKIFFSYINENLECRVKMEKTSERYEISMGDIKDSMIKNIFIKLEENSSNNKSYPTSFYESFGSAINKNYEIGMLSLDLHNPEATYTSVVGLYSEISNCLSSQHILSNQNKEEKNKDKVCQFINYYNNNMNLRQELSEESLDIMSLNDISIIYENRYDNLNEQSLKILKALDNIIVTMTNKYTHINSLNNKKTLK